MGRILITVPTWNEASCIQTNARTLSAVCRELLREHAWRIEVADNGSTDETCALVRELASQDSTISLCEIHGRGKGEAIRQSWLQGAGAHDVFVFLDADLAADIYALPRLIEPLLKKEAAVVCGSRFLPGTKTRRSWLRELLSRAYRLWQRVLLHLPVEDAQCGFKAVSAEVVNKVLPLLSERTWLFDTELIARAVQQGFVIREIPVDWVEMRDGQRRSALRPWKDGWMFLSGVWRMRRRLKRENLSTGIR